MSDPLESQIRADFNRARFKSFINQVFSVLSGQRNNLLSYDDIKEKLRIGGPIYRGMKTVRVDQIAGSLNRYHEFDRAFLPKEDQLAGRWTKVDRAFYQDVHLPPVVLYKVGEVYFVVDGHHRVSVAREQGQEFIEAEVRECATRVNLTASIRPEDLEILGSKVDFLERLKEFPDKTEGDLYLWTLDHQHYLSKEEGQPLQPPEDAAKRFIEENE